MFDGKTDDELRAMGRGVVAALHAADRMGDAEGVANLRTEAEALLAELSRRAEGKGAGARARATVGGDR